MSKAARWTEQDMASLRAKAPAAVILPPLNIKLKGSAPVAPKPARAPAKRLNAAEDLLGFQLKAAGIPYTREFKFHPTRKFRADYSLGRILVEIDGGLFATGGGGHTRGRARMNDMLRDAEALTLGFTVLRVPPDWIKSGKALEYICKLMGIPK